MGNDAYYENLLRAVEACVPMQQPLHATPPTVAAVCPKCRHGVATVSYRGGVNLVCSACKKQAEQGERLRYKCCLCSYEWETPCADAGEALNGKD